MFRTLKVAEITESHEEALKNVDFEMQEYSDEDKISEMKRSIDDHNTLIEFTEKALRPKKYKQLQPAPELRPPQIDLIYGMIGGIPSIPPQSVPTTVDLVEDSPASHNISLTPAMKSEQNSPATHFLPNRTHSTNTSPAITSPNNGQHNVAASSNSFPSHLKYTPSPSSQTPQVMFNQSPSGGYPPNSFNTPGNLQARYNTTPNNPPKPPNPFANNNMPPSLSQNQNFNTTIQNPNPNPPPSLGNRNPYNYTGNTNTFGLY